MSQVKECLQKEYDCSKLRNAVPKSCLDSAKHNCKCKKITACQLLKCGYKYKQPCRPEPCRPISQSFKSNEPFADNSVYRSSFYPYVCEPPPKPVVHKDHMVMAGEFQDETVHRMSYPIQCTPVVQKIIPKDHCLGGTGPMRSMTTQQHDYYVQCEAEREKSIMPCNNLGLFDCPMVGLTTTNLSYQPVCADPVKNFKPNACYTTPVDNMDMNTVQRCSYKVVGLPEKQETPWAAKLEYCKPNEAVERCTVYNYSYKEPGEYVMNDDCGNTIIADGKLLENCCPVSCLANSVEEQTKSRFIKAHQFED